MLKDSFLNGQISNRVFGIMINKSNLYSYLNNVLKASRYENSFCGHYGSSLTTDSNDIDILWLVKSNVTPDQQKQIEESINNITKTMTKSHVNPIYDKSVIKDYDLLLFQLEHIAKENCFNIEFDVTFGPRLHETSKNTIHLNGPMSEQMWNTFAIKFPFHAIGILGNMHTIYGVKPERPIISREASIEYCSIMRQRLSYQDKKIVFRKLAQSLSVIMGGCSCIEDDCLNYVFGKDSEFNKLIKQCKKNDMHLESMCELFLKSIEICVAVKYKSL